jgi:uncharacterized membrane protein YdjX (TVP38/TMEM64 family)
MELSGQAPRQTLGTIVKLAGALLVLGGLTLAWHFTPLASFLKPASVEEMMTAFAASPWSPVYVMGAYLAGGLVAFPLIVLIAATAAVFGPLLGFAYAFAGSIASAIVTYGVGAWLGGRPLQSLLGPRLNRIRGIISRSGFLAIAAVRLVPVAPYTIVNMVAGACRIRLVDYIVGTALGLLPGLLLMSALGHQIFRFIIAPTAADLLPLAVAAVVWVLLVFGAQRLVLRVGNRQ